jgi:putative ABC transport system permease protein
MMSVIRQFKRAPGRIIASVLALALAVGAVGVLAIPTVSEGTLHQAVERDGLADIIVDTTPLDPHQLAEIAGVDGVAAADGSAIASVRTSTGFLTQMIGLDFGAQTMDRVHLDAGRLPETPDEVVVSPALGAIGDTVVASGRSYEIVGHGGTLWWSNSDVLYADLDAVAPLVGGTNRLTILAENDGEAELRAISDAVRDLLAEDGDTYADFPEYLPDGTTPIDADIDQISTLIGMLGVFAGLIALVLLAGTTNTLITERSREVAVMRALGGRNRPLRRRLRRIAMGITGVALVVGLPLGIVISNLIARMVLEEFVGITPDVAIDWWVLIGSAAGALVGARIVSARAARRITKQPLAAALRDRDAAPYGNAWSHRALARIATGGLLGRIATRTSARRPGRTIAVVTQISAAVGAAFLIPSLITSVNGFNSATSGTWQWESVAFARDAGLPLDATEDPGDGNEYGIWTSAAIDDWEVDVYGFDPATEMYAADLRDGAWIEPGGHDAMLSAGFAARRGIGVGDRIELDLAAGPSDYTVVGTLDDSARAIYLDREVVAADLGAPEMANVIWSSDPSPHFTAPVPLRVSTSEQISADDEAGRDAVVMIFGAIGVIVAGVAGLAVMSSMIVSLFERRHELAAMQAIGAPRRRLRWLLVRELGILGALGLAGGLVLGALGTRGIIGSFESSNAVDIGVVDAVGAIPFIVAGTAVALVLLAALVVRSAARRPIAVTLRGAA